MKQPIANRKINGGIHLFLKTFTISNFCGVYYAKHVVDTFRRIRGKNKFSDLIILV